MIKNYMLDLKCPFCKEISHPRHIYTCLNNYDLTLDNIEIRYKFISFNFPEISIKDKIYEEYVVNLSSLPDLFKKYNLPYHYSLFLLDYFGIQKRTLSESSIKITQKKYKKTCQDKYGVDNISQLSEIKEKKRQTFISHYGVDNIWKYKPFYEWLEQEMISKYGKKRITDGNKISNSRLLFTDEKWEDIWKKYKETSLRIYGTDNPAQSDLIKEKLSNIYINKSDDVKEDIERKRSETNLKKYGSEYPIHTKFGKITKPELKVQDILNDLNIQYTTQKKIGRYFFDIYIKNIKLIIEVNGDYWHANPIFYNESDIIKYPNNIIKKASDVWKKDKIKSNCAEKNGFDILYIWENDINKKTSDELKFIILDKIFDRQNEINENKIDK